MLFAVRIIVVGAMLAAVAGCNNPPPPERFSPRSFERTPPKNLALSQGVCVMHKCDNHLSGAIPVKGVDAPSHRLTDEEVDLFWTSPIGGGLLDFRYPDGERVYWVPKVDRVLKLRINADNQIEQLAERQLPTARFPYYDNAYMREWVAELDGWRVGSDEFKARAAAWRGYQQEGLRAYYALVNRDGILFVASLDRIVAYTDAERYKADSAIRKAGEFVLERNHLNMTDHPELSKAPLPIIVGMNTLADGHVLAVTVDGTVIAVAPNLRKAWYYKLGAETVWHGAATDGKGGVYVVGNQSLRKLIWTGAGFSDAPEDGAWREVYARGDLDATQRGGRGSGTAPVLMGLEDQRDQFVLIADAADVNNLVLYWRDDIPADWRQVPGTDSRRIAGKVPVDFGSDRVTANYTSISPTVLGYGAVVANTQLPDNTPAYLDVQLLLSDDDYAPAGMQKVVWDPRRQVLRNAWIRPELSSPNSAPVVAAVNRRLYTVGPDRKRWVMTALNWDSGATEARWTLGDSQRFNPIMLPLQLLPNGDPIYHGFGGVVHLRIRNSGGWSFGR